MLSERDRETDSDINNGRIRRVSLTLDTNFDDHGSNLYISEKDVMTSLALSRTNSAGNHGPSHANAKSDLPEQRDSDANTNTQPPNGSTKMQINFSPHAYAQPNQIHTPASIGSSSRHSGISSELTPRW